MPMSPCNAWNTPTMIIMIAANMMNPTAQPLVSRSARRAADDEYASRVDELPTRRPVWEVVWQATRA
jgi:hypothetical protein